jgi:hypothetical protein
MDVLHEINELLINIELQKEGWQSDFEKLMHILQYTDFSGQSEEAVIILFNLLDQLSYYEGNPEWRNQSHHLYGEKELIENVKKALDYFKKLELC